ncbi:MAG: ribonuclease H-like YkuK family protein [Candidatus Liptonbacteria bacterium]|nr:ribonuclease H-like YkuK family protein [Candidatus Liptonbacteria bacterium]
MNSFFNTHSGEKLDLKGLAKELLFFINEDVLASYKITVGTDSSAGIITGDFTDFITAVVIHRKGKGGRYFWRRKSLGKFYTLRDRILNEALLSIETAKDLVVAFYGQRATLDQKMTVNQRTICDSNIFASDFNEGFSWNFEIHVDIGQNGETKNMISEIVGIVKANNFDVCVKPYSYAASKVADRYS